MTADPVVHFEIIGRDPGALRGYYSALFDWTPDTTNAVAPQVSEPADYGFVDNEQGIPGGIGGGRGFTPHVVFYVGVEDVTQALERAEQLGGRRVMEPASRPDGALVVAQFADPEGNVIGLAGPR